MHILAVRLIIINKQLLIRGGHDMISKIKDLFRWHRQHLAERKTKQAEEDFNKVLYYFQSSTRIGNPWDLHQLEALAKELIRTAYCTGWDNGHDQGVADTIASYGVEVMERFNIKPDMEEEE